MPLLKAGTIVELEVVRKVDFGFFLSNGTEDVLLHRTEVQTEELNIGDVVEVFLYHDHENRLAATMREPMLIVGERAWLKVVDVRSELGIFLDQQLSRDLLLPRSELPPDQQEWPQVDDHLFVELTYDRRGRLLAKLSSTDVFLKDQKKGTAEQQNKTLLGTVYKQYPDGAFLVTEEGYIIFLPRSEMADAVRLGQKVSIRITYVRPDGRLNASTKQPKQVAIVEDSDKILRYLQGRGGSMPYSDKSPPDIIKDKFGMSKAAFKRALGKLMKENKVVQDKGWTHIKEK